MTDEKVGLARSDRLPRLLLPAGAALYLYLNLFTFSNVPALLEGDQTYFWEYALRILQGERVYRDFFQFTTPGTDLVFLALFRVFGYHIWVTNVAVILLGVALCCTCFEISIRLMSRSWAIIATSVFVVLVYGRILDATHHWFSLLAVLCAVRILMPRRTIPRLAVAGALLAVACFFTQSNGAVAALGLLAALAWERLGNGKPWTAIVQHQLALLICFGLTFSVLSAQLIAQIGWKDLWYFWAIYPKRYLLVSVPLFTFRYFPHAIWQVLTTLSINVQRASLYALLVLAHPLVWWHCWRQRRDKCADFTTTLMLLSLPGFFLMLSAVSRPNWGRLYEVFLPELILSVWLLARSGEARRYVKAMLWTVVAFSALLQTASRQRHSQMVLELPAGRAVVADVDEYEKFRWLSQHTKPGDLFFQAAWLNTYFPLKLISPVFADGLSPTEATRPDQVALAVRQLAQKQVKYILWTPVHDLPDYTAYYRAERLNPLLAYIRTHYIRVHVFSNQDEIWQLQPEAGPT